MENNFQPWSQQTSTRSYFFLVKPKRHHTFHWTLTITLLSKYSFKNTWTFIWTVNWTFVNIFKTCLKLIARLRPRLSHLRFYKFKHGFQDTLNPICNCGSVQTTVYYLLYCPNIWNERLTFFNKLQSIDANILIKDDSNISKLLLYGDHSFNDEKNTSILTASIEYIISTKRFDAPLFQNWHIYLSMCSLSLVFFSRNYLLIFFI